MNGWIRTDAAMDALGISNSALRRLRDEAPGAVACRSRDGEARSGSPTFWRMADVAQLSRIRRACGITYLAAAKVLAARKEGRI